MKNILIYAILFCTLLVNLGCEGKDSIVTVFVTDTLYMPPDTIVAALKIDDIIIPDNPQIGDKIKIIMSDVSDDLYFNYLMIDNRDIPVDSICKDTIYSFWPVLPKLDMLRFEVMHNVHSNSYSYTRCISDKIIYKDYDVVEGINIIENDENIITDSNLFPSIFMWDEAEWTFLEKQDTISIKIKIPLHDEGCQYLFWKFFDNGTELPELIVCYREISELRHYPVLKNIHTFDTLKNGVIKIDKWNQNGIYSGITYPEAKKYNIEGALYPKLTFYYKKEQ